MIRLAVVAFAVLAGDQAAKAFVRASMHLGASVVAIPHVLSWTYVQNTHAAFGMFGAHPLLLGALGLPIAGFFLVAYKDVLADSPWTQIALGAIVGGALGNVWDRLHDGSVTDFIDVKLWTETFNVADAAITLGMLALLVLTLKRGNASPATR
ncbi:MAG: signal peptidase II [Candidatus Eremiobacteraeota bacterium]|nr:signal peptidase II [Candidatus Eremiobacteraeota bacterium]